MRSRTARATSGLSPPVKRITQHWRCSSLSRRAQVISPVLITLSPAEPEGTWQGLSLSQSAVKSQEVWKDRSGAVRPGPGEQQETGEVLLGNRRGGGRRCARVPAPRAREAEASVSETRCFHAFSFFSKLCSCCSRRLSLILARDVRPMANAKLRPQEKGVFVPTRS